MRNLSETYEEHCSPITRGAILINLKANFISGNVKIPGFSARKNKGARIYFDAPARQSVRLLLVRRLTRFISTSLARWWLVIQFRLASGHLQTVQFLRISPRISCRVIIAATVIIPTAPRNPISRKFTTIWLNFLRFVGRRSTSPRSYFRKLSLPSSVHRSIPRPAIVHQTLVSLTNCKRSCSDDKTTILIFHLTFERRRSRLETNDWFIHFNFKYVSNHFSYLLTVLWNIEFRNNWKSGFQTTIVLSV